MALAKPLSRILYVDDDASMRELVRTALAGQSEFSVVTCTSGFEALIIVGQELGHHTPVVFVAEGVSPVELRRLHAAGAAEVIPLPFDPSGLPQLIQSIWSRIAD